METQAEIISNLKNLKYYAANIEKLANQQFELDYKRGAEKGINTSPGSVRWDALGAIVAACSWIGAYCGNINANMLAAVSQDKLLYTEEELAEAKEE